MVLSSLKFRVAAGSDPTMSSGSRGRCYGWGWLLESWGKVSIAASCFQHGFCAHLDSYQVSRHYPSFTDCHLQSDPWPSVICPFVSACLYCWGSILVLNSKLIKSSTSTLFIHPSLLPSTQFLSFFFLISEFQDSDRAWYDLGSSTYW